MYLNFWGSLKRHKLPTLSLHQLYSCTTVFFFLVTPTLAQENYTLTDDVLTTREGDLLCFYVDPTKLDSKVIKSLPSAPRPLGARDKVKPFGCRRDFQYEGRVYTIDSFNRADGEHLRPYVAEIPEAVTELNTYQQNKRNVQNVAYIGTAGLLLAITGILLSRQISSDSATTVRNVLVFSGAGIMVGSAVYAVNSLINNEDHLLNAVKSHNVAKPKTPIEVQFGATLLF